MASVGYNVFYYYSGNEKDLLKEHHRQVSYNEEINFKQQVQEFLKEQEDDEDHNQHQWQFDNGQLSMLQSNDGIDHDVDDNDNLDHDMVNNDNELTRNDDDLLLEMENCIN